MNKHVPKYVNSCLKREKKKSQLNDLCTIIEEVKPLSNKDHYGAREVIRYLSCTIKYWILQSVTNKKVHRILPSFITKPISKIQINFVFLNSKYNIKHIMT